MNSIGFHSSKVIPDGPPGGPVPLGSERTKGTGHLSGRDCLISQGSVLDSSGAGGEQKLKPYPQADELLRLLLWEAMPRLAPDMRRHQAATRVACRLLAKCGLSLAEMARHFGVSTPAIIKVLRKREGVAS